MNALPSYPFYTADRALDTSRALGKAVKSFLDKYDALMAEPASYSRGAEAAKLTNALFGSYIMWGIDMSTLDSSKRVDQIVREAIESQENTQGAGI